jgi:hypothetical protein
MTMADQRYIQPQSHKGGESRHKCLHSSGVLMNNLTLALTATDSHPENDKYFDDLAVSSRSRVELHVEKRLRVPR